MTNRLPVLLCVLLFCGVVSAEDTPAKKPVKKPVEKKKPVAAKKVVVVAVQNVQKLAQAQQAAAKKYAETQKAVGDAIKALDEAEKKAAAAEGDESKQAATKKVEAAKEKLDKAKKESEQQLQAVRKAAAALAVVARPGIYRGATLAVREKVDAKDPVERFALFTPGGPLVVDAAMTIDGKPFRELREKLIAEMLTYADVDKDGKATWVEALKSPRFTLGRIRVTTDQQRKQYIDMLDKNKNKLVDLSEVRQFVAQFNQGPAFVLNARNGFRGNFGGGIVFINGQRTYARGGQADVQELLDTDKDGTLSVKEIAAAPERLKSRDADDNDLLYPQELNGVGGPANNRQQIMIARQRQAQQQLTVLLGPTAQAETLFQAIQSRYKNKDGDVVADSFSSFPKLFKQLDKNANGKLDQAEVLALNDVKPHATLAVDLGKGAKGITLRDLAPELTKSAQAGKSISVSMPGVKLSLVANLNQRAATNYSATAKRYLDMYDKDNNGYLSKKEVPANFARQLALWDEDGDGKVYAKEIIASYNRMRAPQRSQIRANAASSGNSLFQSLDRSGDGRLSLREMRTSTQQILNFDENKDKRITKEEIPVTLMLAFGVGNAGNPYFQRGQGNRPNQNGPVKSDAPEWFTRMDRNGDGDITLKEFLGDKETFDKIDTNNDGFIEPKEAKAVDKEK